MDRYLTFITLIIVSLMSALTSCSNKSEIKPELRQEIEAVLRQSIFETISDRKDYKHTGVDFKLDKITEKQYEYKGDKYGTYQGEFSYSFNDDSNSVKVYGIAVFSFDGSLTNVYGCPGIFIDGIFVNSKGQTLEDSKYFIKSCEWK